MNAISETTIPDHVFRRLVQSLRPDADSSLENVVLKATYLDYVISFYAWENNLYKLIIEDFGLYKNGEWFCLKPTVEHKKIMEDTLVAEIHRLRTVEEEKEVEELRGQLEAQAIKKTEEFIDYNFYTSY